MNILVLAACGGAALLSSCASSEPLMPMDRGVVVKIPRQAHCGATTRFPANENCCVMSPYMTGRAVDQSYRDAVRAYGYSPAPSAIDEEVRAAPMLDRGHVHVAIPGERYELGGVVVPRDDPRLFRGLWLGLTLKAEAENETLVEPVYCEIGGRAMAQQDLWHEAVQASILAVLPRVASRP